MQSKAKKQLRYRLDSGHLTELTDSTITIDQINQMGIRTISSSQAEWLMDRPGLASELVATGDGTCIAYPQRDCEGNQRYFRAGHGSQVPACRVKTNLPDRKYLQPVGVHSFPYFVNWQGKASICIITEGEKKALAIGRLGYRAISVPGVWNCVKTRCMLKKDGKPKVDKTGKPVPECDRHGNKIRDLHPELKAVDWSRFTHVLVVFDTDEVIKSGPMQAAFELTKALCECGANAKVAWLPVGSVGDDGMPEKVGADDFIAKEGDEAFRSFVEAACRDSKTFSIEEARSRLRNARDKTQHEVILDRSPPGTGKSYQNNRLIAKRVQQGQKCLVVVPSHRIANATVKSIRKVGVNSVASYPVMTDKGKKPTCKNFEEAQKVMELGLSVRRVVCHSCEFKDQCEYLGLYDVAENADVAVCTSARAALQLSSLMQTRKLLVIEEQAVYVLAPFLSGDGKADEFEQIRLATKQAIEDGGFDPLGRNSTFHFLREIGDFADKVRRWLSRKEVGDLPLSKCWPIEGGWAHKLLYAAIGELELEVDGSWMRLGIAAAEGRLRSCVIVNTATSQK